MNIFQKALIFVIGVYQIALSPVIVAILGPSARCRFTPSCSQYALEAVRLHGAIMGGWLALRRLVRCHPWGGCGDDPPPARWRWSHWNTRGTFQFLGSATVPVAPDGVSPCGLAKNFRPEAENGERDARAPQNLIFCSKTEANLLRSSTGESHGS